MASMQETTRFKLTAGAYHVDKVSGRMALHSQLVHARLQQDHAVVNEVLDLPLQVRRLGH